MNPLPFAIALMAGGGAVAITGLGVGIAAYIQADGVSEADVRAATEAAIVG